MVWILLLSRTPGKWRSGFDFLASACDSVGQTLRSADFQFQVVHEQLDDCLKDLSQGRLLHGKASVENLVIYA